jgi:hypothetical protein
LVLEDVDEAQTILSKHNEVVILNKKTSYHRFPELKLFIVVDKVLGG